MDTTKKYILMCEKGFEIQEGHQIRFGDLYYSDEMQIDGVRMERYHVPNPLKKGDIWLPRQDQLQEMVDSAIPFMIDHFQEFAKEPSRRVVDGKLFFNSMEQLWLAFVMKEKFNKTWDRKQWTLQKNT